MKKKNRAILFLFISLFLIFSRIYGFAQFEQKVSAKLWITVPKNLSVFHILVILTSSGEKMKKHFSHSLANEAMECFQDFKNHPAVQFTDKLFKEMWYFPFNYMAFYTSELPEAKLIRDFPSEFELDENIRGMFLEYIKLVNNFYTISKFQEFWESYTKDIESVMKEVKNSFPQANLPGMMEEFYGRQIERYYLVPCPFMANSATHVEVKDNGKWYFYHLAGAGIFSDPFFNIYTAFHEFSHSFIEPISEKYSEQIDKLAYLYEPLKERFQRMGYRNWDRAFNEHMVTACQLHFTRKAFADKKKNQMIQREKRNDFKLIYKFYNYLKEYDENRDYYQNLNTFYPVLLKKLSKLQIEEYRKPGPMGFYLDSRENKLYVKDVVPNSALEKSGIQKGDILFSIEEEDILSEEIFYKAKEKFWNRTKEGNSIKIVIIRENKKIIKHVPVPFITDHRYVESRISHDVRN